MKKICVIEDSPAVNKLFSAILKKNGYESISFLNGKDVINWTNDNVADLLLMDMLLPDYTGSELLRIIKQNSNYTNIPVIAVSGFATEYNIESLKSEGFDCFLTKPVDVNKFINVIKEHLYK